jgi:hypothetical protein
MEAVKVSKVMVLHTNHLSTRNLRRFMDFYIIRVKGKMAAEEILEVWNRHAKCVEETVFIERK